ncbi:MAG: 50S ribosomal protein L18 [Candidatus Omnitrophica bacterium]|nr:50S ribosomal protein L18 [Candidatus Omnitrophota bacterium]
MTHISGRTRRHFSIRKRIVGTAQRPRLSLSRSIKNLNAQLIDDLKGLSLFSLSTQSGAIVEKIGSGGNVKGAGLFGELFAEEAVKKGFSKVVFDRGGYLYHGRIKAFAESCRKKGLVF